MNNFEVEAILDDTGSIFNSQETDEGLTFNNGDQAYVVDKLKRNGETYDAIGYAWADVGANGKDVLLYFALARRLEWRGSDTAEILTGGDEVFLLMRSNMAASLPDLKLYNNNQVVLQDIIQWDTKDDPLAFVEKYTEDMINGTLPSQAQKIRDAAPKGIFGARRLG